MRVIDYERPLPEAGAVLVGTQKQGRELHRTGASCGRKCLKFVSVCVTLICMTQIHDIVSPSEMEAIKQKTGNKMKVKLFKNLSYICSLFHQATPYSIKNKSVDFSYERTSKV